ncbi:MAG: choice-of-anchor J domain-containing protein [Bacteroidetes bacterium]|nr:choice-of-anchor J domain-containing protein [Bacteroidota bacterium]
MKKMKQYSKIMTVIIALAIVLFACVDDDFDTPPIRQIPTGDVITIENIKTLFNEEAEFLNTGTEDAYLFDYDASIYGTVTMDNETDNSYRTFYIQDNTGAIAVYQDVSGGIYIGDSVRIYLRDLVVMQYSGLFQLNSKIGDGVNVDSNIVKMGFNVERNPEAATIDQILSNKEYYQGRLVKISDVQFVDTDTSKTFANPDDLETENRLLQDNLDNQIFVRTSGYANFAGANVPDGSGSIIAIVGQYNSDMQLYIRKLGEVEMDNARFDVGGGGGTGEGTGTFDDPYNVANAISNSTDTEVWVEGYLVGVYETVDASGNTLSDFTPSFTSPFYTSSNVIIADSDSETDISNCIVIQVPSGDIRTAVNMVDNPGNLGKIIKFKGDRLTYFGEDGLKNVNGYWLDGDGINPEDPVDVVVIGTSTVVSSLNEDFSGVTADQDFEGTGWLNANVQGERYWQGKEFDSNKYIQATAYNATADNIESWVVTPGVDLSTPKKLSFDTNTGYYKHAGLTVYVSTDFDGNNSNLFSATWTDITSSATIAEGPSDSYGTWVNSGDIDLSAYSGTIYVMFKYTGDNSSNTTTFQLDNVKVIDL